MITPLPNGSNDWRTALRRWLEHNSTSESEQVTRLRAEFNVRFPKDQLAQLTLDDYAIGRRSKDTFCYWLEFKTKELGGIHGGTVAKFGVWWSKATNSWQWNARYDSAEHALAQIRQGLVEMVQAAAAKEFDAIDNIGARFLGKNRRMLRMKPLYLYFASDFLPVYQMDHIAHFMQIFGVQAQGDMVSRNTQLLSTLRALPEFKGFDTRQMGNFLYQSYSPFPSTPHKPVQKRSTDRGVEDRELGTTPSRRVRDLRPRAFGTPESQTGLEDAHPELASVEEEPVSQHDERPVISRSTDWAIAVLRDMYDQGKLDLQPRYQREYVWELKPELPSRLIESLLLEIPIPPIYLGKIPGGRLEVIDGQQRLTTLMRFVRNEFALQRLRSIPSLNGRFFRGLSDEQQEKILSTPIHSQVIDTGSSTNLRYEVFERLNRGSMALNEQELRNCVYRGSFSDLLQELEGNRTWRRVKGTDEPEARFVEREMILRFFAFADRIDYYRGNLRAFLNDYMENHAPRDPVRPHDEERIAEMRAKFEQTMLNVWAVFGEHAGRLYDTGTEDHPTIDGKWETKFSISALDIQASALIAQPATKVQVAAEQIRESYLFYFLTNPQVRLAISRQPAGTNATRTRWFGFRSVVQEILTNATVELRFFSYEFRKQLYDKAKVCALCHNEIHSFEDCTVDHIHPYARGGKTEPGNAQLAHRSCNASKCAKLLEPES